MGVDLSKQSSGSIVAIAAVANITQYNQTDLVRLQSHLEQVVTTKASMDPSQSNAMRFDQVQDPNVTRQELNSSLDQLNFFLSDRAICDRLFTMLDKTGEEAINATEFLVVASLLLKLELVDRIQTAMQFGGWNATHLDDKQVRFVVTTLSNAVSYFGDAMLPKKVIASIVKELVVQQPSVLPIKELAQRLGNHPIILDYIHKRPNEALAQRQSISFSLC